MEEYKLKIFQVVGSEIAVSSEDGDTVFEKINHAIEHDKGVILDFENLKILTTAFLNSAIGQLYSKYSSSVLSKKLKLENISDSDKLLLKTVTTRAKEYFENKEQLDPIIKESLGDE
jgi:hypothetical protein